MPVLGIEWSASTQWYDLMMQQTAFRISHRSEALQHGMKAKIQKMPQASRYSLEL